MRKASPQALSRFEVKDPLSTFFLLSHSKERGPQRISHRKDLAEMSGHVFNAMPDTSFDNYATLAQCRMGSSPQGVNCPALLRRAANIEACSTSKGGADKELCDMALARRGDTKVARKGGE